MRFRKLLARYRVIYINGARLAVPFFLLSFLTGKQKWFYHLHLCHSRLEKMLFAVIAACSGKSRLVMASDFILQDFAKDHPAVVKSRRCEVVQNCLSSSFGELPFSDRFSGRKAALTVALVGRVVDYKGHEALPALARRFPDIRFVIVGACTVESGTLLPRLLAHGLPNLEYLGETRDLPGLLERLPVQISIVPSRWEEPFGLTSIESMAASCLTLVSGRGMLPRIAAATGAWCFQTDQELETMLASLHAMPAAKLAELARRQHRRTQEHFGFETFRRGLLSLIGHLPEGEARDQALLPV